MTWWRLATYVSSLALHQPTFSVHFPSSGRTFETNSCASRTNDATPSPTVSWDVVPENSNIHSCHCKDPNLNSSSFIAADLVELLSELSLK
jgi:hypothetical protein